MAATVLASISLLLSSGHLLFKHITHIKTCCFSCVCSNPEEKTDNAEFLHNLEKTIQLLNQIKKSTPRKGAVDTGVSL